MKNILRVTVSVCAVSGILTGCSLDRIVNVDQPQVGTDIDHKYLETRAGAIALLNSVRGTLQWAVSTTSEQVGYFTDELLSRPAGGIGFSLSDYSSDTRFEAADYAGFKGVQLPAYDGLQSARVKASYARYFLRRQADSALNYAISAAYSYEGYAIVLLAENLCSGVPLSEAPYGETAVYGRALPTDTLFRIAVTKFDSALAIPHDSVRFHTLARIGKARALVSLGRYREAADVVSGIGQSDVFTLTYTELITPVPNAPIPAAEDAFWTLSTTNLYNSTEIANLEGTNGLIWYANPANIDPRLPVTVNNTAGVFSFPAVVRQQKFPTGNVIFTLAGWVEAKMIEAEHLLHESDANWIDPINEARRSVGLPDTASPATESQRVNLLFRERALWFYGQGTRLSDMRRLVRQYGRAVNSVYPVGQYTRSREVFSYGDATAFIPTVKEFTENYNYTGCIHKNP